MVEIENTEGRRDYILTAGNITSQVTFNHEGMVVDLFQTNANGEDISRGTFWLTYDDIDEMKEEFTRT